MNKYRALLLGAASLLLTAGFAAEQQRDVTLHGVIFTKVRTNADGLHIGEIDTETVVGGRACRAGWLHLYPDGTPAAFTAAQEIVLPRVTIPAGTWVNQSPDGVVTTCAFPEDTLVQGHLCRGTGGPKGVQVAFYPDGALRQFFLASAATIDGVPCDPSLTRGVVELHENGRLKSCRLGQALERDGRKLRKGARITLSPDGRIQR